MNRFIEVLVVGIAIGFIVTTMGLISFSAMAF